MIAIQDVIQRALTGPIISGKDFDLKVIYPTAKKMATKYEIKYDRENPVPSDDNFADRLWEAGIELFIEVGVFCPDTERRILFSKDEVQQAINFGRGKIEFGDGRERKLFPIRKPEDTTPPWCSLGAGGCAVSTDEILFYLVREYARNPFCDSITTPSLSNIDGQYIIAGSPLELEAAIRNVFLTREALQSVGRPGLPIVNGIASAAHASSHIGGMIFGIRPTDAMEIGAHHELRVDMDSLNKVYYTLISGSRIWAENGVILGGIAGGPATTAIISVAYNLLDMLVLRGSTQHPFPIHFDKRTTTTRDSLWVRSVINQAISRNSWLPIANLGYVGAGPTTKMAFLETAAWVIASVVSGGSIEAEGITKNAHVNHTSPIEPYFAAEIAHAVPGMSRTEGNIIVKSLLEDYEDQLADAPVGMSIQDCMNLVKGEITPDYRETYRSIRQKMIDQFGLSYKHHSIYL